MAKDTLEGLNVAILVTDGFEQVELTEPRKALDASRRHDNEDRIAETRRRAGLVFHGSGAWSFRSTCPSIKPNRKISTR